MPVHTPHDLRGDLFGPEAVLLEDQFPRDAQVLNMLKLADTHFCNLAERYHALNRAIHRIEGDVESAADLYLARLRRQRLSLLDEIAVMIEEAEAKFCYASAANLASAYPASDSADRVPA